VLVRATPESHQEIVALPAVSGPTWNRSAIAEAILRCATTAKPWRSDIRPQT